MAHGAFRERVRTLIDVMRAYDQLAANSGIGSRHGRIRSGVRIIHSIEYFERARRMGRNRRIDVSQVADVYGA